MASKPLQPAEPEELRVVLWGKTGVGKSASGNILLGDNRFTTDLSSGSMTQECQMEKSQFDGKDWIVVDTPGLLHTKKSREEISKNILSYIVRLTPGPHVFLLVLRAGEFSRQDQKMLEAFQEVFKDAKEYTIVLLTHGDECNVDEFLNKKTSTNLKRFIEQSSQGYHVFNNEDMDESQAVDLRNKIKNMVEKNKGKCYKNELFEMAITAFEEAMKSKEQTTGPPSTEERKDYWQTLVSQGIDKLVTVVPNLQPLLDRLCTVADLLIQL